MGKVIFIDEGEDWLKQYRLALKKRRPRILHVATVGMMLGGAAVGMAWYWLA